jgi:hypothetical protein
MSKTTTKRRATPRQIVGLSLDPATAKAFKAEAVARGVSVRKLFEEMWTAYTKKAAGARS